MTGGAATGSSGGVRLRVVSYNIHSSKDDLDALGAVVRDLEPDVVVVQEGARRFRWRHKNASLAARLRMVLAGGGLWSVGNLVLTTLRVRAHRTWDVRFPLTPGRHLRGAVFVECEAGGTRFVVTGSHLSTDPAERPAQAAAWRAAIREVGLPLVAGGDLNEPPGGPAWHALAAEPALVDGPAPAAEPALVDVAEAAGRGEIKTYPCAGPLVRLDGIFVDPRIKVVDYDVVDTPQARRASDHLPVKVDLLLPGA